MMKNVFLCSRSPVRFACLFRILLVFVFCFLPALSQNTYNAEGIILDKETRKPIPGASIRLQGAERGTYSLSNGKFRLPLTAGKHTIKISSLGYEPASAECVEGTRKLEILLKSSVIQSGEVNVVAEINAENVIKRAIARKNENREKIKTFSGLLYSKLAWDVKGNVFGSIEDKDRGQIRETFSRVYQDFEQKRSRTDIIQRRQTANVPNNDNLLSIGNFISFYEETVPINNAVITTPLANDALSYYSYSILGRSKIGENIVYEIAVKPTSDLFPGFEGTIKIVEGTYNLISADLAPSKATAITFVKNLQFSQKYEQFPGDMWLPTYLLATGEGFVEILKGVAELNISVSVTSFFSEAVVNTTFPDTLFTPMAEKVSVAPIRSGNGVNVRVSRRGNAVVTVAPDADSAKPEFWDKNAVASLSPSEQSMYTKIDSIVAAGPKNEERGSGENFEYSPILAFNRVAGLSAGIGLKWNDILNILDLETSPIYSFGLKKAFGTLGANAVLLNSSLESPFWLTLRGGIFSNLSTNPSERDYFPLLNSISAALFHQDFFDYFREDGWNAGLTLGYSPFRLTLDARFSRQFREENTQSASLFTDKVFRENPMIQEGNFRTIRAGLQLGNAIDANLEIRSSLRSDFRARIAGVYGEEQYSGNSFRFLEGKLLFQQPTFYTGYIPMFLKIAVNAGFGSENMPTQYQFVLPRQMSVMGKFGHFSSAPIGMYGGTEFFSISAEHNFSDMLWRWVGLPTYNGRGLECIAIANTGKYWQKAPRGYFPTNDFYTELGFGIGKIPLFISNILTLRFDAVWGIGQNSAGNFGYSFSLSSPF